MGDVTTLHSHARRLILGLREGLERLESSEVDSLAELAETKPDSSLRAVHAMQSASKSPGEKLREQAGQLKLQFNELQVGKKAHQAAHASDCRPCACSGQAPSWKVFGGCT